MATPFRNSPALDRSGNQHHVRTISWSKLDSVDRCILWVENEFLGKDGSKWIRAVINQKQITDPRRVIEILSVVFPTFIFQPKIFRFSAAQSYISESFFDKFEDDQFLDAAYKIFLGRLADRAGLEHYKKMLAHGVKRSKIISDFSKSYEFMYVMNRKLLGSKDIIEAQNNIRLRSENVMYRVPKYLPTAFFFRKSQNISENQTGSEWHFVYLPSKNEKMILSPGMNLCGRYGSGNSFTSETDWILFGPKIPLRSGKYEILLELDVKEDFRYIFDGASDGGLTNIFSLELCGPTRIKFLVELEDDLKDFEVRILNTSSKREALSIKHLSLTRVQ